MVKLFVMVFAFTPAPKTDPAETCTRTPTFAPLRWAKRASASNLNPAP